MPTMSSQQRQPNPQTQTETLNPKPSKRCLTRNITEARPVNADINHPQLVNPLSFFIGVPASLEFLERDRKLENYPIGYSPASGDAKDARSRPLKAFRLVVFSQGFAFFCFVCFVFL